PHQAFTGNADKNGKGGMGRLSFPAAKCRFRRLDGAPDSRSPAEGEATDEDPGHERRSARAKGRRARAWRLQGRGDRRGGEGGAQQEGTEQEGPPEEGRQEGGQEGRGEEGRRRRLAARADRGRRRRPRRPAGPDGRGGGLRWRSRADV